MSNGRSGSEFGSARGKGSSPSRSPRFSQEGSELNRRSEESSIPTGNSSSRNQEAVHTGPHAVLALLEERPAQVNRLLFLRNSGNPRLYELQKKAESLRIPCQQLPAEKLNRYSRHHQGVIALCHLRPLDEWPAVKEKIAALQSGIVVVLAGIEDPHNLGACARSALALGAAAILLPARGGCGLTESAMRASAGALERVTICRPPILDAAILELKEIGWRVIRLWEGASEQLHKLEPAPKTLLIVGGEEEGVPPYLRKVSDLAVRLPMNSAANSYNASVALSLALYELARQQGFPADGAVQSEVTTEELERELLDF